MNNLLRVTHPATLRWPTSLRLRRKEVNYITFYKY